MPRTKPWKSKKIDTLNRYTSLCFMCSLSQQVTTAIYNIFLDLFSLWINWSDELCHLRWFAGSHAMLILHCDVLRWYLGSYEYWMNNNTPKKPIEHWPRQSNGRDNRYNYEQMKLHIKSGLFANHAKKQSRNWSWAALRFFTEHKQCLTRTS